jgi:hypothetical protein
LILIIKKNEEFYQNTFLLPESRPRENDIIMFEKYELDHGLVSSLVRLSLIFYSRSRLM